MSSFFGLFDDVAARCYNFQANKTQIVVCRPMSSFLGLPVDVAARFYNFSLTGLITLFAARYHRFLACTMTWPLNDQNFQVYKTCYVVYRPMSSSLILQNSSRCLPPDIIISGLAR
jgi:hypothetical protein